MKRREYGRAPWRDSDLTEPVMYASRPARDDCVEPARSRGGIFRNNRGLLITVIDVGFVTVLGILYLLVIRPLSEQINLEPYRVSLSAEIVSETVHLRATIANRSRSVPEGPAPIVTISSGEMSVQDLAPPPQRRRTIVLEGLPLSGEGLFVTVTINGESRSRTVAVD